MDNMLRLLVECKTESGKSYKASIQGFIRVISGFNFIIHRPLEISNEKQIDKGWVATEFTSRKWFLATESNNVEEFIVEIEEQIESLSEVKLDKLLCASLGT